MIMDLFLNCISVFLLAGGSVGGGSIKLLSLWERISWYLVASASYYWAGKAGSYKCPDLDFCIKGDADVRLFW